jgi:hypothetical protein
VSAAVALAEPKDVRGVLLAMHEERGALRPRDVVDVARDPSHPLHDRFTWDDGEAGEKFRLLEAHALIRSVTVRVVGPDSSEHVVRAFASLPSDRGSDGVYRTTITVLDDATRREELKQCAAVELESFRRKYAALSDLIEGIEPIVARLGEPEKRRRKR